MSERNQRVDGELVFLLASEPWRESSLKLEVFSRNYGRVALLARGARRRQGVLRGVLLPFVPVRASWYGTGALKTLHGAEWVGGWPQPRGGALFGGLYVNELVLKMTAREDASPALFHALAEVMREVCSDGGYAAALRRFEWALLDLSGYAPDLRSDALGEGIRPDAQYWVRPEYAVLPLEKAAGAQGGVAVSGRVLAALRDGVFPDDDVVRQALKVTRLLLDFRLPEGVCSRRVLQQLQGFPAAGRVSDVSG